jgi:hypothetical protein
LRLYAGLFSTRVLGISPPCCPKIVTEFHNNVSVAQWGSEPMHILWTILVAIVIVNGLALALIPLREFNRRAPHH